MPNIVKLWYYWIYSHNFSLLFNHREVQQLKICHNHEFFYLLLHFVSEIPFLTSAESCPDRLNYLIDFLVDLLKHIVHSTRITWVSWFKICFLKIISILEAFWRKKFSSEIGTKLQETTYQQSQPLKLNLNFLIDFLLDLLKPIVHPPLDT